MPRFIRGEAHQGLLSAQRQTGRQNHGPVGFARGTALFTR